MMAKKLEDQDSEEDLLEALKAFDPQSTGKTHASVLTSVLSTLGEAMKVEDIEFVLKDVSKDQDGCISHAELASLLMR